jgi:hypothetical protein
MTPNDLKALEEFRTKYPTWWWKIGWCDISRDFDCAPQSHSPESIYIKTGNNFDRGFCIDSYGTIADAIYEVMRNIEKEIHGEKLRIARMNKNS